MQYSNTPISFECFVIARLYFVKKADEIRYYNNDIYPEELELQEIMDSIIESLENNKGFQNIKDFLCVKKKSEQIENFVALIYLYHFEKIDFKKSGKIIDVILNAKK